MTTAEIYADIKDYQKFGNLQGNVVFANALAEKLREQFPKREFKVKHYDPQWGTDYSGGAIYSDIFEITGRFLGIFPCKKRVALLWAGRLPCTCRNGISISSTDLREVVEQETERLNRIGNANKKVFYD
jgi:hypothetical protein